MAGFSTQNRPYDPEKDSKVVKQKKPTTFQPAESVGMDVKPSKPGTQTPSAQNSMWPDPIQPSKLNPTNLPNKSQLKNDPFGFKNKNTANPVTAIANTLANNYDSDAVSAFDKT